MKYIPEHSRVRYRTASGRRMRGTVVDYLPLPGINAVPVLLRKRVVWMDRKDVRKLP